MQTLKPMAIAPIDRPILVYLEKPSLGSHWHVAQIHPNAKFVGHLFHYDCPKMIGWIDIPNVIIPTPESQS